MKYGGLKYENSGNLGDEIQSLAGEQFLPRVDKRFHRDRSSQAHDAHQHKYLTIMNGWYSHHPETALVASETIDPVYVSVHISPKAVPAILCAKNIEFFRNHQPIGCRDQKTTDEFRKRGIDAYSSKCLTITFPKRDSEPSHGKVFVVDAPHVRLPRGMRADAVCITHRTNDVYGDMKFDLARRLLDAYRDQARLVVTTRLHCALPCTAMGIPVIYFCDPSDYRIAVAGEIGLTLYEDPRLDKGSMKWKRRVLPRGAFRYLSVRNVDWDPEPVDIEHHKEKLIADVKNRIESKLRLDAAAA